jgi:hypothetical protein
MDKLKQTLGLTTAGLLHHQYLSSQNRLTCRIQQPITACLFRTDFACRQQLGGARSTYDEVSEAPNVMYSPFYLQSRMPGGAARAS